MADAPTPVAHGTTTAPPPPAVAVIQWLITGASEHDILQALHQKYPKANATSVLAAVRDHFTAEGQPDTDALRGWVLASYRELYRRMLEVGDFDGARKALKNISEVSL